MIEIGASEQFGGIAAPSSTRSARPIRTSGRPSRCGTTGRLGAALALGLTLLTGMDAAAQTIDLPNALTGAQQSWVGAPTAVTGTGNHRVTLSAGSGRLRIQSTSGLSPVTGYAAPSSLPNSGGAAAIAFEGSIGSLNAALASLQLRTDGGSKGVSTVTATIAPAGSFYLESSGSYYEFVSGILSWTDARNAARARRLNGLTGYLAHVTTQEEHAFLLEASGLNTPGWLGGYDSDPGSGATWVFTNEPSSPNSGQTFWSGLGDGSARNGFYVPFCTGEPNSGNPGEPYLQIAHLAGGCYNDLDNTSSGSYQPKGYFVEYTPSGATAFSDTLTTTAPTATIDAAPDTVRGDGSATSTVTVTLKRHDGGNLGTSGGTVALAATLGGVGPVANRGDGTYTATLTAPRDHGTGTVTGTLNGHAIADDATITFTDATPPVITGPDGSGGTTTGATAAVSVAERETAVTTVSADEAVTWSLGGPDASAFSITPAGAISFRTPPDHEAPTDSGGTAGDNAYVVGITAADGEGNAATQTLTVTVEDLNDLDGGVGAAGGVAEPVDLPSTAAASDDAVTLMDFTISDGGTGDGQSLGVTAIDLTVGGTVTDAVLGGMVWRLDGPDATDVAGSYDAGTGRLRFAGLSIAVPDGSARTYAIRAHFGVGTGLADGATITLALDGDTDLAVVPGGTQMGATNAVTNGAGTVVEVVATRLTFDTQPAGSVSGMTLAQPPVVSARDASGNLDTDFADMLTLGTGAPGTLTGGTATAVSGTATFPQVTYAATADGEVVTLTADDDAATGDDLAAVASSAFAADVVATRLTFATQPAPLSVQGGVPARMSTAPVVRAVDAMGLVDTGHATAIRLAVASGAGSAALVGTGDIDADGTTVTLVPFRGAATFPGLDLTYTTIGPTAEGFVLRATSGGLAPADSARMTGDPRPVVSDGHLSISGGSGTGGAFIVGDVVTVRWDNSASGDAAANVTGVTADLSAFGGGTAIPLSEASGIWTVRYTITAGTAAGDDRNVAITVTNAAGLQTTLTDGTDAVVDAVPPSGYAVAFVRDRIGAADAGSVSFDLSGAENGASFAYAITSDGGGTVSGAGAVSAAAMTIAGIDVTGVGDGTLTVSLALTDSLGNAGAPATDTAAKDTGLPMVALTGPTAAQSDPFTVTVTFSEAVAGVALDDLSVTNGTASGLAGGPVVYTATVAPIHDGPVSVAVAAGRAVDGTGNPNTASTPFTVRADRTGTPVPGPSMVDSDGDGLDDDSESATADRDGDGIMDRADYDPQGYFYCEDDGRILPGGGIVVTGPNGSNDTVGTRNDIRIVRDGSSGEYQWFAQRPGTYTMALRYPPDVGVPSPTRTGGGPLDVTSLLPDDPASLGSSEFGATGRLADASAGANSTFHTTFQIEAGDPNVIGNNVPVAQCAVNAVRIEATRNGAEANRGAPTAADFVITQGRVSTVDTVLAYSVGGTALPGTDFAAPSGTVTIPAGDTATTITVDVLEDGAVEGVETIELVLDAVTGGDAATVLDVERFAAEATISDDDQVAVVIVDLDLTATEGRDDDAAMTFSLGGLPIADVTLAFSGDAQCDVAPRTMTFTASDYATPQRLTIAAIDDTAVEGRHVCRPTVTVRSSDARFDALTLGLAAVTVVDDLVDQVRDALSFVLQRDLEGTIGTQSRRFASLSGDALDRLRDGTDDLRCGTQEAFDVDGAAEAGLTHLDTAGVFGTARYDCATGVRTIVGGDFALNHADGLGTQATFNVVRQRERRIGDHALRGWFLSGYASRTRVGGLMDGHIDGLGFALGIYGARALEGGLFVDHYLAGGLGHHRYDLAFADGAGPIGAAGFYSYGAVYAGVALSGEVVRARFTLRPRVGVDLGIAEATTADVTARRGGRTRLRLAGPRSGAGHTRLSRTDLRLRQGKGRRCRRPVGPPRPGGRAAPVLRARHGWRGRGLRRGRTDRAGNAGPIGRHAFGFAGG
ncbi:invasin domain 3-containing protein [Jannaschia sp. LMIT008]|uniref:invasin domain 3-containing protein n=1 Tax=Jannaschia maritima TaxID=3032585 RepID=UPI0028118CA0|nr:invasin domain 3-containing protein [Jannaschia sp. LMIT008]